MMFLVVSGHDQRIISSSMLDRYIGWNIYPLQDCPISIKKISVSERSVKDIIKWYENNIETYQNMANRFKRDLKKFKEMIKIGA